MQLYVSGAQYLARHKSGSKRFAAHDDVVHTPLGAPGGQSVPESREYDEN
jgi:hypothetical protein